MTTKDPLTELLAMLRSFAIVAPMKEPDRVHHWTETANALEQLLTASKSGGGTIAGASRKTDVVRKHKITGELYTYTGDARVYRAPDGESEAVQITHSYHVFVTEDGRGWLMTQGVAEAILEKPT